MEIGAKLEASYTLFRIGGEKLERGEEGRRAGALNGTRTPVSNRDNERPLAGGPFCTRHRDSLGIGTRIRAKLDFVLRLDTRATPKNVACDKAGSFVLCVFLVYFCSLSLYLSLFLSFLFLLTSVTTRKAESIPLTIDSDERWLANKVLFNSAEFVSRATKIYLKMRLL